MSYSAEMVQAFLSTIQVGSNNVVEARINVRADVQLLFIRHLQALARHFAVHEEQSWQSSDTAGEFTSCWLANIDDAGLGVPILFGLVIEQSQSLRSIVLAVGVDGRLGARHNKRTPDPTEKRQLVSKLKGIIRQAQSWANAGLLRRYEIAIRIDGYQPLYPHRPIKFGQNLVVTLPARPDSDRDPEFGNNPGIGLLFTTIGTDEEDARKASSQETFLRVLFWGLVSGTYCRGTKVLFTEPQNWSLAAARLKRLRLPDSQAASYQGYSIVDAKRVLRRLTRKWDSLMTRSEAERTRLLSAMAAYRSARQLSTNSLLPRTLAVVSYIAALEALVPQPRRCSGTIKCDVCQKQIEGHAIGNHQHAIFEGLRPIFKHAKWKRSVETVRYAYSKVRSPYVHAAQSVMREFAGYSSPINLYDESALWEKESATTLCWSLSDIVREVFDWELR